MTNRNKYPETDMIHRLILKEIDRRTDEELEKIKDKITKRLVSIKDEVIASVSMAIFHNISMQDLSHELIIRIKKEENNDK